MTIFLGLASVTIALATFLVVRYLERRRTVVITRGPKEPHPLADTHRLPNGWLPQWTNQHREVFEAARAAERGEEVDDAFFFRVAGMSYIDRDGTLHTFDEDKP